MKENIDRSVWINYFNEFSQRNQSRPTRLQMFGELGAQEQEHGLPFEGITMTNTGILPSVEIMLGGRDADWSRHLTHVSPEVQEITPKRSPDGRDEALEIVSGKGYRNLLCFEREARMAAAGH
jgi:hypothetical protein